MKAYRVLAQPIFFYENSEAGGEDAPLTIPLPTSNSEAVSNVNDKLNPPFRGIQQPRRIQSSKPNHFSTHPSSASEHPASNLFLFDRDLLLKVRTTLGSGESLRTEEDRRRREEIVGELSEQLYRLEQAGRSVLNENVRLAVYLCSLREQTEYKYQKLYQLNLQLARVISQLDEHQQLQSVERCSTFSRHIAQILYMPEESLPEALLCRIRQVLEYLKGFRYKVDHLEGLLVRKKHEEDEYLKEVLERSTVTSFQKNLLELRLYDLEQYHAKIIDALKQRLDSNLQFIEELEAGQAKSDLSIPAFSTKISESETLANSKRTTISERVQEEWVQELVEQLTEKSKLLEASTERERMLQAEMLKMSYAVYEALKLTEKLAEEIQIKDLKIEYITRYMAQLAKDKLDPLSQQTKRVQSTNTSEIGEHDYKACLYQRYEMKIIILHLEGYNSEYQDIIDELKLEIDQLKRSGPTRIPPAVSYERLESPRVAVLDPESHDYARSVSDFNKIVGSMLLDRRPSKLDTA